ncbi:MAG: OmpA family protein [Desulfobacterales bacterium]|nr:MAG: OmpA family protein [Desulfobacterales bacterium]
MKAFIFIILNAVICMLCAVNISLGENCNNAEEIIGVLVSKPPEAKTEEDIKTAIAQCPDRPSFYKRAGDYYTHWYEREHNTALKTDYKNLAIRFYEEGAKSGKGSAVAEMGLLAANLKGERKFSKPGFRALTPVAPDSKGQGLWLEINFELDSYELTKTAQKHLDELGEELADRESIRVSLQGHTDMYGSANYNKDLSTRRAESAKNYLIHAFKIKPERIVTLGFGFERLADEENPYSPVNRRVEVLKIAQ